MLGLASFRDARGDVAQDTQVLADTAADTADVADAADAADAASDVADTGGPPAFNVVPSNVGDRIAMGHGAVALVAAEEPWMVWVFNTDSGGIMAYDGFDRTTANSKEIRPGGLGVLNEIPFMPLE